ncbi:MAG: type VI secretion system contractile sheath small subunit [Lentisphaerales bacterium]|nr:type VI secretion system contractile sheath small subunit [Lentisphaerales bacterium]
MAIQDEIPKSRLTLKYKTEVNGEPEDIDLPMRFLVNGDFSLGTSKDRKVDLDERRLRSMDGKNTDEVMKDMGIGLNIVVDNKIDPDTAGEELEVNLDIDSMKSLSPADIATKVPKIKSALLLKKLLMEVMSSVDNKKEFRKLLNDLMSDQDAVAKLLEELKDYEGLKLPGKDKAE